MKRSAGILLAISSLPSEYGIGCFDESAYSFIDFLKESGQSYWQILPIGPTGYGDSPYQSFSTFAGNPYYISLKELKKQGLITENDCSEADFGNNSKKVNYEKLYKSRYKILKKAYTNSKKQSESYIKFCFENKWVEDYSLFMALKEKFCGASWDKWDEDVRSRKPYILEKYRCELSEEIGFYKFIQFQFFTQWSKLKKYANENGVRIIGDIPIYAAFDSVDVWSEPYLFMLDDNKIPKTIAGCPPDGFSADGQLWGNPIYNWSFHRENDYKWWIERLKQCFELYDVVRIDHFRGFDEYYAIPYGSENAKNGKWEKGPGIDLFSAVEKALGKKEIIAEDLGFMTDSVKELVKKCGFPNMKVLEFAFDSRDTGNRNEYLPHNYSKNCVAYTGTHDNQTIISWFRTITSKERDLAREYLCDKYTPDKEIHKSFIGLIMQSSADLCIIPMQDWLGLDDTARMNKPSTVGENWRWRLEAAQLSDKLCDEIRKMSSMYGR